MVRRGKGSRNKYTHTLFSKQVLYVFHSVSWPNIIKIQVLCCGINVPLKWTSGSVYIIPFYGVFFFLIFVACIILKLGTVISRNWIKIVILKHTTDLDAIYFLRTAYIDKKSWMLSKCYCSWSSDSGSVSSFSEHSIFSNFGGKVFQKPLINVLFLPHLSLQFKKHDYES